MSLALVNHLLGKEYTKRYARSEYDPKPPIKAVGKKYSSYHRAADEDMYDFSYLIL